MEVWTPKAVRAYVPYADHPRTETLSTSLYVSDSFDIRAFYNDSTVDGSIFLGFLTQYLKEFKKASSKNMLLLLDGARTHSEEGMNALQKRYPFFRWMKLPPYSPDANPVEYVISELKAYIYKHTGLNVRFDKESWMAHLQACLQGFINENRDFSRHFAHAYALLSDLRTLDYKAAVQHTHDLRHR
jgi:transposase